MQRKLFHSAGILACALLWGALTGSRAEAGVLGSVRIVAGGELGSFHPDRLADFTFFPSGQPLEGGTIALDLTQETGTGFYLGLELRPQLELSWSRVTAESRYELFVNDELITADLAETAGIVLPQVDLRLDMIHVVVRPPVRLGPVTPIVQLGYGWLLLSQNGPIDLASAGSRPLGPEDFSDSDRVVEVSVGAMASVGPVQFRALARTLHSRWDAQNGFIPSRITHPWLLSLRGGVAF